MLDGENLHQVRKIVRKKGNWRWREQQVQRPRDGNISGMFGEQKVDQSVVENYGGGRP